MFLVIITLSSIILCGQCQMEQSVIAFPDPNLEMVIREAIDKPEGDIYASDLYGIKLLNADMSSIKDITGLERCINLENLSLRENEISDASSLSGLTGLKRLELSSNQITDVSPLSNLTNLIWMDLRSKQIPDASTLRISQASNNYIYPTIRFLTIVKGREWSRWVDITLS